MTAANRESSGCDEVAWRRPGALARPRASFSFCSAWRWGVRIGVPDGSHEGGVRLRGLVTLLALSLALAARSASAGGEGDSLRGLQPAELVGRVYSVLAEKITESGTPITLEVLGVRVIPSSRFDDYRFGDVLSFDPPEWIQIVYRREVVGDRVVRAGFPAMWASGADENPYREQTLAMTLREAVEFSEGSAQPPQVAAVFAVDVRVTLAGRSLAYKAIFLLPEYREGVPVGDFTHNDPVLQPLPEMLTLDVPIIPLSQGPTGQQGDPPAAGGV